MDRKTGLSIQAADIESAARQPGKQQAPIEQDRPFINGLFTCTYPLKQG
ncbi:hypothetical protein P7H16_03800 [Paenibacillus larvae]|nr:hypothetical protein [Paenibacillus larvae]MDT2246287.1 hypothetical protein [Paenibacillus larvae]MDT2256969.1 hypothetical protein [Paenibacillus larvae]